MGKLMPGYQSMHRPTYPGYNRKEIRIRFVRYFYSRRGVKWEYGGLVDGGLHVVRFCGRLRRHCRRAGHGIGGEGVFITDECLRVQLERLSHEFSDAMTSQLHSPRVTGQKEITHPHTTTSSSILPHNRATVELNLDP